MTRVLSNTCSHDTCSRDTCSRGHVLSVTSRIIHHFIVSSMYNQYRLAGKKCCPRYVAWQPRVPMHGQVFINTWFTSSGHPGTAGDWEPCLEIRIKSLLRCRIISKELQKAYLVQIQCQLIKSDRMGSSPQMPHSEPSTRFYAVKLSCLNLERPRLEPSTVI